ncbi:MAG TPA: ferrous iron transport protein B [Acholeplasmatales bacterium]|nr:MAG: ferrous iron transport protein B [Tenericutes bacterium GWF2_57_13]HAQ57045.1 ferrous iron transport protein B [Acholeplasmatales bacterium]
MSEAQKKPSAKPSFHDHETIGAQKRHGRVGCVDCVEPAVEHGESHGHGNGRRRRFAAADGKAAIQIALVGNPNSGKTTLFNGLTGSNQYVGNWPGVTVEKKAGKVSIGDIDAEVTDLPGIYSLSTISLEEEITVDFIAARKMNLIVNIVDASNLERNLFLTFQLLDARVPVIIALNCMDIVEKRMDRLDIAKLEQRLGVPVVPITASKRSGLGELIRRIGTYAWAVPEPRALYSPSIEALIERFAAVTGDRLTAVRCIEDGEKAIAKTVLSDTRKERLTALLDEARNASTIDFDMVIPNDRYDQIIAIVGDTMKKADVTKLTSTDRIDRVLTHRFFGIPLFLIIMFTVFWLAFGPLGTAVTDGFVFLVNLLFGLVANGINALGMAPWVTSLVNNAVFGGLAAVLGFLPQLAILFLFLSVLEDTGYMARAAFIMDRALRKFGLSGKSFIPMLLGFGCSVPAMAATRTLDQAEDRKITTMIIPFVSCGAKAPIYGVIAGALFAASAYYVVFSMYLLGILVALFSAVLFKKTVLKSASANYLMELPEYRMPTMKNTFLHTWERVKGFVVKAGTVLLGAFIVIWFLSYFGTVDGVFRLLAAEEIEHSLLGAIGKAILPLFRPIGFTDWRATVAVLTGFVAKESVVGTLGILYGVAGDAVVNGALLYPAIRAAFTPLQAYSFMAFALLSAPCIAALAAMKKELGAWKWFLFILAYEMAVAYLVSLAIYQIGSLGSGGIFTALFLIGAAFIVFGTIRGAIRRKGSCASCYGCSASGACEDERRQ